VPLPESRNFAWGCGKRRVFGQQCVRHDGSEMFERYGDCQLANGGPAAGEIDAFAGMGIHCGGVVAGILHQSIEGNVFARVHCFLLDEPVELIAQCRVGVIAIAPDTVDEKGLTLGEGDRQRIEECGGDRVIPMPPANVFDVPANL